MLDIFLTKIAVFFATLGFVSLIPGLANLVTNTHWAIFLTISIILALKPLIKSFR